MKDAGLKRYLPDDVHPETIKRDYLLNVNILLIFLGSFYSKKGNI